MISQFPEVEKSYLKMVTSIVVYSNGAIGYEDAWMLSGAQRLEMEEQVAEKIKLSSASMGMI